MQVICTHCEYIQRYACNGPQLKEEQNDNSMKRAKQKLTPIQMPAVNIATQIVSPTRTSPRLAAKKNLMSN